MKSIIGLLSFYVYFFFGLVSNFLLGILFRDSAGSDLAFSALWSSLSLTAAVTTLIWSPFLIGYFGLGIAYMKIFSFELSKWQLRVCGVSVGLICYYFNGHLNEIAVIFIANSIALFLLVILFEVFKRIKKIKYTVET